MIHNCKLCDYKTKDKSNFDRHLQSRKHITKVKEQNIQPEVYKCIKCGNEYSRQASLNRHAGYCTEKKINTVKSEYDNKLKEKEHECEIKMKDKDIEIITLKKSLEQLESEKKSIQTNENNLKQTINVLTIENSYHKRLINDIIVTTTTSMNTLNYAKINYPNAPALEAFNNFELLKFEQNYSVAENILFHYRHKTLVSAIGNMIIKHYKKSDPSQQSIWNSDCSRFVYIIRTVVDDTIQWTADKGGNQVQNLIITPILSFIKSELNKFCFDKADNIVNSKYPEIECEELRKINILIDAINDGGISKDIIRYITGSFYLHKELQKDNNYIDQSKPEIENKINLLSDNKQYIADDSNNIKNKAKNTNPKDKPKPKSNTKTKSKDKPKPTPKPNTKTKPKPKQKPIPQYVEVTIKRRNTSDNSDSEYDSDNEYNNNEPVIITPINDKPFLQSSMPNYNIEDDELLSDDGKPYEFVNSFK